MHKRFSKRKDVSFLFDLYSRKLTFTNFKNCLRPVYGLFNEILAFCKEDKNIVDFGCGEGPLTFIIAKFKHPKMVFGYDINPDYIQTAKQINIFDNVSFVDDIENNFPKPDLVIIADVLHHILPEPEKIKTLQFIFDLNPAEIIIKDLDPANRISSMFNAFTDYLSTRSKVEYISVQKIKDSLPQNFVIDKVVYKKYFLWSNYIIHIKNNKYG
jgi:trans-aconitate methyltransferase